MKETKRKGISFLRSYFDVLNELETDKDKLGFLMAVINKQFLNEDPEELSFIVNLCYQSQRHQIESSVKGWERATSNTLLTTPPTTPPTTPSTPSQEEEEKEEEKGEVKEDNTPTAKALDFDKLLTYINKTFSRKYKVINKDTRQKYKARQKEGYTSEDIKRAIDNCKRNEFHIEKNFSYCTPLFFSQSKTLEMYGTETAGKKSNTYNPQG